AVALTERGLGGDAVDLAQRLDAFRRDPAPRAKDARRLARSLESRATPFPACGRQANVSFAERWRGAAATDEGGRAERDDFGRTPPSPQTVSKGRLAAPDARATCPPAPGSNNPSSVVPAGGRLPPQGGKGGSREAPDEGADASLAGVGAWLAAAFPDRIAIARGKRGEFLMANGRAAALEPHDALAGEAFLAIGEIVGRAASARILTAAPLTLEAIERIAGASIASVDELSFDGASASLRARRRRRLGALILAERNLSVPADGKSALALAQGALGLGLARLPWTKSLAQWRDRVLFLRRAEGEPWPDLSDQALAASPDWLAPFLVGKTRLDEFASDEFAQALRARLPYELLRRLETEAPTHFVAPTGSSVAVDYGAEGGPAIALRVQELFGLSQHPALAGGRVPLTLHLLSPAHRPIQITRDLPGFWKGSWAAARADLRGRYPRHFWPEDPASATPTSRAKPRGT
ncbi:MAG: ATP-dependent helicase C-terminal domain-containing protein, partial [Roseiarcus sp.]